MRQIKRNKWTGIVRKIIRLNLKIDDSKLVKKQQLKRKVLRQVLIRFKFVCQSNSVTQVQSAQVPFKKAKLSKQAKRDRPRTHHNSIYMPILCNGHRQREYLELDVGPSMLSACLVIRKNGEGPQGINIRHDFAFRTVQLHVPIEGENQTKALLVLKLHRHPCTVELSF